MTELWGYSALIRPPTVGENTRIILFSRVCTVVSPRALFGLRCWGRALGPGVKLLLETAKTGAARGSASKAGWSAPRVGQATWPPLPDRGGDNRSVIADKNWIRPAKSLDGIRDLADLLRAVRARVAIRRPHGRERD